MKGFRWVILGLLFVATVILYIDRSALGILAPYLQEKIGWTEAQYGIINSVFMIAYAICFLIMGRLIDRTGTRMGYLISIGIWSVAVVGHVLARTWIGFAVARFGLGVGQSGSFPSAIRAVAEWFPEKDRALAIGIFNGGANMGTIIAPLVIPVLVLSFDSWKAGFLWTLPISLIWMMLWLSFFKVPDKSGYVSEQELRYIESGERPESSGFNVKTRDILSNKSFWAIALAKFMADPVWWFYLFWGAKFLHGNYGVNLKEIGLPFFTIYLVSWGIGIFLGWFSSMLLRRGWSLNKGRKSGLLLCAIFALPVILVPHVSNMWVAVGLIALAAGGHCGWSANIFSLMADVFPKNTTASVAGFGGFGGAIGGAIIAFFVGHLLQNVGMKGYSVAFAIAGSAYLIALFLIQLLIPRIRAVKI